MKAGLKGTRIEAKPGASPKFVAEVEARRQRVATKFQGDFPEPATLTLEIGCGHGHFLTEYAAAYPKERCVGIDIIGDRVERARRKRERRHLDSLAFYRCEAAEFLAWLPEHVTFRRVFVLFPDPWPKRRHWKNRLLSRDFLAKLSKRAGEGTELFFRTDHTGFFDWVVEEVTAAPDWSISPGRPWPFEHPTVFQEKAKTYKSLSINR